MDAAGNKTKFGAARHGQRCPRMVRQHENRGVVGRLVTPPALPAVVRPRAPDRAKHVASEYPGTDSLKAFLDRPVVDTGLAAITALHALPQACMEEPLHQFRSTDAERMLETLGG